MKTTFGEKIKSVRDKRGYTQEKMAEILGMSVKGYQKIETNESAPNLKRMEQISKALDMPILELLSIGENVYYITENQHNSPNATLIIHWNGNKIVYTENEEIHILKSEIEKLKMENEQLKGKR